LELVLRLKLKPIDRLSLLKFATWLITYTSQHTAYSESGLGVAPWPPKHDFGWYPTFDRIVFSPAY